MNYLTALQLAHRVLAPRNYLEIGCRHGASLALSAVPSIGIDPAFELRQEFDPEIRLFEMTSDAFFAAQDPARVFGAPVDFAFIDGMHLAEFALRDFMNIERSSHSGGVIAIDDILPDAMEYATRERNTKIWTGDIYRTVLALRELRPQLDIRVYSIEMKGFCLVSGLQPGDRTLFDSIEGIEARMEAGDWVVTSREALEAVLSPLPPAQLKPDLEQIATARRGAGA